MTSSVGSEIAAPPDPTGDAVPFDFRQRVDLARDHIRRVEIAHEAFARRMDREFSTLLRSKVHFTPAPAEQVSFTEYVRSLPNPAVVAYIEFGSLPGHMLFEIDPATAFNLISVMLGGRTGEVDIRRPTDIETSLLALVAGRLTEPLIDAFEPLLTVYPEVVGFEFNPLLIPTTDPPGAALRLGYTMQRDGTEIGSLALCYPLTTLQPVGEILRQQEPDEVDVPDANGPLVDILPVVELPVSVRLNPVTLPAAELLALEPGDVIRLSHQIDEPVVGVIDDCPLAEGRIGRSGSRVAFEFKKWRTE